RNKHLIKKIFIDKNSHMYASKVLQKIKGRSPHCSEIKKKILCRSARSTVSSLGSLHFPPTLDKLDDIFTKDGKVEIRMLIEDIIYYGRRGDITSFFFELLAFSSLELFYSLVSYFCCCLL
ncbi:hypothetical protein PanWU01x14_167150, partial [Parasponia andersonii]